MVSNMIPSTPEHKNDETFAFWVETAIVVLAIAVVLFASHPKSLGQSAISRLATVVALVDHGTWFLERPLEEAPNSFEVHTIDKVEVKGHLLSSKPPLLPLLMTAEYLVIRQVSGLRLDNMPDTLNILWIMTLTFVGLPYVIALLVFWRFTHDYVERPWVRIFGLAGMAFGTQYFGFASTFNNHVAAASFLIVYLALVIRVMESKEAWSSPGLIGLGLVGGLVMTFDIPSSIYVLFLGILMVGKIGRSSLLCIGLGVLAPLVIQTGLTFYTTGSPLPVQLYRGAYLYEASYWRNPVGIDALSEAKWTYAFNLLFGTKGIFSLYPILVIGLMGFVSASRNWSDRRSQWILAIGAGFLILCGYYILQTDNYGGEAYGFRWGITSMVLLVVVATVFLDTISVSRFWALASLLLIASIVSASYCRLDPWRTGREWPLALVALVGEN